MRPAVPFFFCRMGPFFDALFVGTRSRGIQGPNERSGLGNLIR